MGSKTRRLRLKTIGVFLNPELFRIPPRHAMTSVFRDLLMASLLQRFADRDAYRFFGIWPRCADGRREHDMKGLPRCPACGFEPTVSTPGHARDARKASQEREAT